MNQKYKSGLGKDSVIPEEIKGWNWGAFMLNWIWGIGNSTYIALLMFVPVVNFVMIFVLGAKGNEWAWRNRTWRDVEHFKSTQKKWRNAGLIFLFIFIPIMVVSMMGMMKGEAYDLSLNEVKSNTKLIEVVGEEPKPGFFVLGEISYNGSGGRANLNYSVSGDKGEAEIYVYATKLSENWELQEVLAVEKKSGDRIVILTQQK